MVQPGSGGRQSVPGSELVEAVWVGWQVEAGRVHWREEEAAAEEPEPECE